MRLIVVYLKADGKIVSACADPTSSDARAPTAAEVFPANALCYVPTGSSAAVQQAVAQGDVSVAVRVIESADAATLDTLDFGELSIRIVDGKPDPRFVDHPAWTPPATTPPGGGPE